MTETLEKTVSDDVAIIEKTPSETFFQKLVGLSEAVTITGKNKGQISKDTTAKRLPYELNEQGHKRYKVADLYNLYGFKKPTEAALETGFKQPEKPAQETLETAVELAVLKEQLKAKDELLRLAEEDKRRAAEEIRDLRQSRDRLIENTTRLTLMLTGPQETPETSQKPSDTEATNPAPWYKRLFK